MATTPAPRRRLARTAQEMPANAPPTVGLTFAINRYRVLFSDGETVDFLSYSDHSGIREQMLDHHWPKRPKGNRTDVHARIEGIAHLGPVYEYTPDPAIPSVILTAPASP